MTATKPGARPVMLVVGGPPGSGKTTFFPIAAMGVDAFSIDDRCAQIVGNYRAIPPAVRAVSRECEQFVADHIDARRDLSAGKLASELACPAYDLDSSTSAHARPGS